MTKHMRSQEDHPLGNTDQSMGRASIVLEPDTFERFMESCRRGDTPNPALKRAAILAKERGIGSQKG